MRKLLLFSAFAIMPFLAKAQYYWDFGGGVGVANILGDIGGKEKTRRDFVADLKFQQTRQSANAFARYKITQQLSIKGSFNYATLRGADSLSTNPARHYRNLSFRNNTFGITAECQYFFYEVNDLGHTYRYKDNFRAYIGLGIGAIYHSPKGYLPNSITLNSTTYESGWYKLRPLMTEGHRYTKITAVVPASAGFYFTINKFYRIGWHLTLNTTFTDYLDDISTYYDNPVSFTDPLSTYFYDRTNHSEADAWGDANGSPGFGNNFGYGAYYDEDGNRIYNKRGDPTHMDAYLTSNVEFSYVIRGKSSLYRSKYGSIFKGKKYKKRKVRAKF
jgi:Outer membrane protein beta-barrel domain